MSVLDYEAAGRCANASSVPDGVDPQYETSAASRHPWRPATSSLLINPKIVNGIRYVLRSGCAWRLLAHDLPPWSITFCYFHRWRKDGMWQTVHDKLGGNVREIDGRNRRPSAAVLDSQSVKTTEEGGREATTRATRSTDASGTCSSTLSGSFSRWSCFLRVSRTNVVLGPLVHLFLRLRLIWADGGAVGQLVEWVRQLRAHKRLRLEIVERSDNVKGFQVLPRRWVVERTFGWLGRQRRPSKAYESSHPHK